jgi:KDO2-lipid IV(A) lauroyltransferase
VRRRGETLRGETPKETVAYWGYRTVEWLATTVPEEAGRRAFEALGRAAYRRMPNLRATVAANQARVLGTEVADPRVATATREAFELYARYWFDAFRVRVMPLDEFNRRTTIVGLELVDSAIAAGTGCICVLPHTGNWDVGGAWFGRNGYRIVAVAEELKPRRLFDLFVRHREAVGLKIVGLSATGHVGTQLKTLLAQNHMVALVADRDLTGRGIEVEMFGAPRRIPAGPALLSLTTGAPILCCPTFTRKDGWEVRFEGPLEIERTGELRADVAALTRLIAERFERAIASRPTDWHMFQPAWGSTAEVPAAARR